MERGGDSDGKMLCKQVCCSLVMLLIGLLFSIIIIVLAYFTYQTAIGSMVFCSFWTDIPGRLAICITCYYMAGICGYFPIPQRCRLHWFPEPFRLWSFESWRKLIRNLLYPTPSSSMINRLRTNAQDRQNDPTLALLRAEYAERFYDCLPIIRRRSTPVPIVYPDSYTTPAAVPPTEMKESPRNESPEVSKSANESFMSFDSPVGGFIVPMARGKSSRPRYPSNSSIESSNNRSRAAKVEPVGAAANHEREDHGQDVPPRHQDAEEQLPKHPRFPWGLLRNPGGIPGIARVLHKRNIRLEKREADLYSRRQKREAEGRKIVGRRTVEPPTVKGAEGGLVTDNEGFDPTLDRTFLMERERVIAERSSRAPTETRDESGLLTGHDCVDLRTNRLALTEREMIESTGRIQLSAETTEIGLVMGIVPDDSTANRRRQLPSQRFSKQNRSRLRRQSKTTSENVDNLHEFRLEIHGRGKWNTSHRKSQSAAGPSDISEYGQNPDQIESKKKTQLSDRISKLQCRLDRIKRVIDRFERDSKIDTGVSGMTESGQNIDMEAGRQIVEAADRNKGSSDIPASSDQTKTTEKPDTKITLTSHKDESKDENSDSNPKDV